LLEKRLNNNQTEGKIMTKPVKVGDIIVDKYGDKAKVLEVFENSFIRSKWEEYGVARDIFTFEELASEGWKVERKEEKWVPEYGEEYIYPVPSKLFLLYSSNWGGYYAEDKFRLEHNLVYHLDDKEACIAHAKRMLEVGRE